MRRTTLPLPIALAFFASGLAGLMHQVAWARLLAPFIGATGHAQAAVLAVFMGGLALGSAWLGRRADQWSRPLKIYLWLEIIIGGLGLLLPWLIEGAGALYVSLLGETANLPLRFALGAVTVLPPAVLMGGTLPILARALIGDPRETRRQVGRLYALNSFGAVLGAGFSGFWALPALGVHGAIVLASALNLIAGLVVWPIVRRAHEVTAEDTESEGARTAADPISPAGHRLAVMALAISGVAAMGHELVASRIIALTLGSSAYSFTVMLMAFVGGVGLGGALMAWRPVKRPVRGFALSQIGVALTLLAATPLLARLPWLVAHLRVGAESFLGWQIGKAALCVAAFGLPATLLGIGFPLVAQITVQRASAVGAGVGSTYAWNTLGNVLGALAVALVALPIFGVGLTFELSVALNLVAGLALLAVGGAGWSRGRRLITGAVALTMVGVYGVAGRGWVAPVVHSYGHFTLNSAEEVPEDLQGWLERFTAGFNGRPVLFLAEDDHATVLVTEDAAHRTLYVNGKPDASSKGDLATQVLLAHAPLFLAPDARSVLLIGYGSGITAGAALAHPIERLDVVETSRAVLAADVWFAEHNHQAMTDARVRVVPDDGLRFVKATRRRYDAIISEPSNPWIAGVGALFTVEAFSAVRDRLTPDGVFTMWFHEYHQTNDTVGLVLRTLQSVFPHALVFREATYSDLIVVASMKPLSIDFAGMERRFERLTVRDDLARAHALTLAGLLAYHAIPDSGFAALAPLEGPLNTLSHERLEFLAPRALFENAAADLIDAADPLLAQPSGTEALLDRYIRWRAEQGEPVRPVELVEAARPAAQAGAAGKPLARALVRRAQAAPTGGPEPSRPARGAVPTLETLGYYEALAWGPLLRKKDPELERALYQHALKLRPDGAEARARLDRLEAGARR